MKQRNKKVVVGGTFNILHQGHKSLLKKAFGLGKVTIGLTSDKFARKTKKRKVKPFNKRKSNLEEFCLENFSAKPKIRKIEDIFGFTLREDFDYIIVSPETYKNAVLINKERQKRRKKPIKIIKIKFVLDKKGKPISSNRLPK